MRRCAGTLAIDGSPALSSQNRDQPMRIGDRAGDDTADGKGEDQNCVSLRQHAKITH
jgi:hypothetical protein